MSEYKHTISKEQPSGFSESPNQETGNTTSPNWFESLTKQQQITVLATAAQAKRVVSTGFQAVSGQLGSARLEEQTAAMGKLFMIGALARISEGVTLPGIMLAGEVLIFGINNLVDNHALNLENAKLRATTGVMVNYNAGGYY